MVSNFHPCPEVKGSTHGSGMGVFFVCRVNGEI